MKYLMITSVIFALSGCTMFSGPSVNEAISQANRTKNLGYINPGAIECSNSDMADLVDWVESRPLEERYVSNNHYIENTRERGEVYEFWGEEFVSDGEDWSIPIEYGWRKELTETGRDFVCVPYVSMAQGIFYHDDVRNRSLTSYIYVEKEK